MAKTEEIVNKEYLDRLSKLLIILHKMELLEQQIHDLGFETEFKIINDDKLNINS